MVRNVLKWYFLQISSFKVNPDESIQNFKIESTDFMTPISFRSDVTDYESYAKVFLSKYGLSVPQTGKRSKSPVSASSSSSTGWAYIHAYNLSSCATGLSPHAAGGLRTDTCINTGDDASYYVTCSSDTIDVYRYSSTDCLSTYTTKSITKGCQSVVGGEYDDWFIISGIG